MDEGQSAGLFGQIELEGLEKRITAFDESNMYEAVLSSTGTHRVRHADNYLAIHLLGEHREEVTSLMTPARLSLLVQAMYRKKPFDVANDHLNRLTSAYLEYPDAFSDTAFSAIPEKLLSATDQYLTNLATDEKENRDSAIKPGDRVKVITSQNNVPYNYATSYVRARNVAFPENSRGTVVEIVKEGILVKFDGDSRLDWSWPWKPSCEYDGEFSLLGGFAPYELRKIGPDTSDVDAFRTQITTLAEHLTQEN